MKPVLQPENIYGHPHQEQDVILWYNRALWHSIVRPSNIAIERLKETDKLPRLNFQSHMALG